MDNVNDWLYIVFLIIAGISGLFSSGKKKKHSKEILGRPGNEVPDGTNTTQDKGFWEILQEIQKEKPKSIQTQTRSAKNLKKQPQPASTPFLSGESIIPRSQMPASALTQTQVNEEDCNIIQEQTFTDTDELRKAIIYSEILNRKY